jgi:hypothetical protein
MRASIPPYETFHGSARPFLRHVVLPLLGTAALVGLYFTPVEAVGCVNRGLAAIVIAVVSAVAAMVTGRRASREAREKDGRTGWWLASTVILLVPLLLLVWPLG